MARTYGDIATAVARQLVSASSATAARIPDLVLLAQVAAERKVTLEPMCVRRAFYTIEGTPNLTSEIVGAEEFILRARLDEDPYWQIVDNPAVLSVAGSNIFYSNPTALDTQISFLRASGEWSGDGFTVGQTIMVDGMTILAGGENWDGIPLSVISIDLNGTRLTTSMPRGYTDSVAGSIVQTNAFSIRSVGEELPDKTMPMTWASIDDIHRLYGSVAASVPSGENAGPKHLVQTSEPDSGLLTFAAWPPNSDTTFRIVVPVVVHKGSAAEDDLPNQATSSWWTRAGGSYLEAYAIALGFEADWDTPNADRWYQIADRELNELVKRNARSQMKRSSLQFPRMGRNASPARPRFF